MTIQLELDSALLEEALTLGHHKSKKAAVNAALAEYVRHRKRLGLIALAGTIDYDPSYDYKKLCSRRKRGVKY